MLRSVQLWLLLWLTSVLSIGTGQAAYSLYHCAPMGTLQTSCCCPKSQEHAPCDQLERARCCDQQRFEAPAVDQDTLRGQPFLCAPLVVTRVRIADLYAPERNEQGFSVREAPRAIGPPLIFKTRKLLI